MTVRGFGGRGWTSLFHSLSDTKGKANPPGTGGSALASGTALSIRNSLILLLLLLPIAPSNASPRDLVKQLVTGNETAAGTAASLLADQPPESLATWISSFNSFPPPDTLNGAIQITHKIDNLTVAPAFLTVPPKYKPSKPTPLIILLHGGVAKPEFRDGSTKDWHIEPVVQLADKEGWLVLCPMGKIGCLWWDKTGIENIIWLIGEVKRRYNVDDDRVVIAGFSDGAAGAYHIAMVAPDDFAAFFPWSGHIAMGSMAGGVPAFLPNLRNRPLFASNGGRDRLFPADGMKPFHQLAVMAGARLSVTYYDTASHSYDYMPPEWAKMPKRLRDNPRHSHVKKLYWEAADTAFGGLDWLEVTGFDFTQPVAKWKVDEDLPVTIKSSALQVSFPHSGNSVAIEANLEGNHFTIQTSQTASFILKLSPELVRFDAPIRVTVNGKEAYKGKVQPDARFLLEEFLKDRDRRKLWWEKVEIAVPK